MNRPEQAIGALERAVSIFAKQGGHPFNHAEAKFRYAKALVAAGREYDRALVLANDARDLLTPHGDLQSRKLEAIEKAIAEWTDATH